MSQTIAFLLKIICGFEGIFSSFGRDFGGIIATFLRIKEKRGKIENNKAGPGLHGVRSGASGVCVGEIQEVVPDVEVVLAWCRRSGDVWGRS